MRKTGARLTIAAAFLASSASAQSAPQAAPLPVAVQITAAVLPLPPEMRAGATVLGYDGAATLSVIRKGTNGMTCLAPDPKRSNFHVACYHESMEPFMLRGRELRAQGTADNQVDTIRFAEAKAGKLVLPKLPASLYSLTGPAGSFDMAAGEAKGARRLFVVYVPYATAQSTGLSTAPKQGEPWLMMAGTPKAHIMFVGSMQ
ncbi:MAG TPA: hypothetical protein VJ717_18770 [Gemmatimonadaceae bacterium]|nr:hypothetical protein [Gemmatimonadaceae bacterium]